MIVLMLMILLILKMIITKLVNDSINSNGDEDDNGTIKNKTRFFFTLNPLTNEGITHRYESDIITNNTN